MSILVRHNVHFSGEGSRPILFAHGFGCDQNMWRLVAPAFRDDHRVVLFDHLGSGRSDLSAYSPTRHATLQGYADDVLALCRALELTDVDFVGHSVSASIGLVAAIREPARFRRLVLVAPSPCYVNDGDYVGGFSRGDIQGLLDVLDSNYLGWASSMAPVIMGNKDRPELSTELQNSFCRTDPEIARQFARVAFLSDCRGELPKVTVPSLILQCSQDMIVPDVVGGYLQRHLRGSELVKLRATGHCPHLSAPAEVIAAMRAFL